MNFLEQLAFEWYGYQGYFVRTNIKFGKRAKGGYIGEIDVAAFNPKNKCLIHIETSTDSYTWDERRKRFQKKFEKAFRYYPEIFDFNFRKVECVAIVGFSKGESDLTNFGETINVILVPQFMKDIARELKEFTPLQRAVPESYPLLRAIQFTVAYGDFQ